jgi:hypothetical protein
METTESAPGAPAQEPSKLYSAVASGQDASAHNASDPATIPATTSPLPVIIATLPPNARWSNETKTLLIKSLWARFGRTSIPQADFDARKAYFCVRSTADKLRSSLEPVPLGNGLAPILLSSSIDKAARQARQPSTRVQLSRLPLGYTDDDVVEAFKNLSPTVEVLHVAPDYLQVDGVEKSGVRLSTCAVYIPANAPILPEKITMVVKNQASTRQVSVYDRRDEQQARLRRQAYEQRMARKRSFASAAADNISNAPAATTADNMISNASATTTANVTTADPTTADAALAASLQQQEQQVARETAAQIASDAVMAASLREDDRDARTEEASNFQPAKHRRTRTPPVGSGSPPLQAVTILARPRQTASETAPTTTRPPSPSTLQAGIAALTGMQVDGQDDKDSMEVDTGTGLTSGAASPTN